MKLVRRTVYALAGLLLAGLTAVAVLWFWSDADTSLATTLNQLTRFLSKGQTLEVRDVRGSVRAGGSIGWLRWQQGLLSVEASDVSVAWSAQALRRGELRLERLDVGRLRIDDRRVPAAPAAPSDLSLPLKINAQFSVANLEWVGPPALQASSIAGHYLFDGQQHVLDAGKVNIASGSYGMQGSLQALAPMTLSAQLTGTVQTILPGSRQTLSAKAHAELKGQLAGLEPKLELLAQLAPERQGAVGTALQASASAQIRPWQAQPIVSALLQWQALDLAALWPQAPQTRLNGKASVAPAGAQWQAHIQLNNALSGPWNAQRLPLDSLQSELEFSQGQWNLKSLQATGAGGRIEALGSLARTGSKDSNAFHWQGSATLHAVNPAAIDSRLATRLMDGELKAQQGPSGIAFQAQLQAAAQRTPARGAATSSSTLQGLRLKSVTARGLWLAPTLSLDSLQVQTDDAQLQGHLTWHSGKQAAQGRITLTAPGTQALLEGGITADSGLGEISVQVKDAAALSSWLERLPGSDAFRPGATVQGNAELNGRWQGGWQRQGRELQIDARVHAAQLDVRGAGQGPDQVWRLRELQAGVSGTLAAWKLKLEGKADNTSRRFTLAAQAHGGQGSDGVWQAQLDAAQLGVQDSLRPGAWALQLGDSVALNWRHSAASSALGIAAGSARLSGPTPGTAILGWQATHWSQQGGRSHWRSEGSLQGLPLAWLDQLGNNAISRMGLSGDLLLGGQWQASSAESLQLRASFERSSGDLMLQTDDARVGGLRAGLKEAKLQVTAEGDRLTASLRWDSLHAGQAQADFSTRLLRQEDGWTWPQDAPLTGTLRAKMPPLSDWVRLAPPGWRLRGTLEASADLSGTRDAPQWHGSVLGQELAVSSVADGIDFSKGTLRANIRGQRLEIVDFTISGAGSKDSGLLSASGAVDWLPATGPTPTLSSRLRMTLDVRADALRVSAAADRRLVLSGQLNARLADARLTVRGAIKADQALFVLAEDTAPTLGEDVVLRSKTPTPTRSPQTTMPAASARLGLTPDILLSLDLGERFRVRGHGLSTRIGGKVELRSGVDSARVPRLIGELRTLRGTYRAYGQNLTIEEGVLRFDGPYDNPTLDILAIRPNLQQRVGVRINGRVLAPVVQLYADPDLPDAEKLSWLVLGRSAANGGSEAALLQQAALSLLGDKGRGTSGGLARRFGFDELSIGSSANSNATGGNATDTTVTLGKHLARNFYVAYEHGLSSAMGTFYIFYALSRQFTVRAQTGEKSAVDLIFTLRYD